MRRRGAERCRVEAQGEAQTPRVTVLLCTHNDAPFLRQCIASVLRQTFDDFELVIVDDASTDETEAIVSEFKDARLRYFRRRVRTGSIAEVRQFALCKARGELTFFIDGDCWAHDDWLRSGMGVFRHAGVVGMEGKVVYAFEGYRPTLSDVGVSNLKGGKFLTANMAFRTDILREIGFDPGYWRLGDRELALRASRQGQVQFNADCVVVHQKKRRTVRSYLKEAERYALVVRLARQAGDRSFVKFRVVEPKFLLILLVPPVIAVEFVLGRIRSWDDVKLLPALWLKAAYMRLVIWREAIRERIFLI